MVAIYGRGLGFGEIRLPHHLLAAHTTDRSDQAILVRADAALRGLAATHPGLVVLDRVGLAAAGQAQRRAQGWPSLIALAVLLAYIAIAVVNTLVMATAARGREFALLQLLGTSRTQVARMMRIESLIVVGVATVVGTLVAVPPLVGIGLGLTESPIPSVSAGVYAAIIGATAALGLLARAYPRGLPSGPTRSTRSGSTNEREWAAGRRGSLGHGACGPPRRQAEPAARWPEPKVGSSRGLATTRIRPSGSTHAAVGQGQPTGSPPPGGAGRRFSPAWAITRSWLGCQPHTSGPQTGKRRNHGQ